MSAWRREAIEKLPECRDLIQSAESVSAMWVDLWAEFVHAHDEPINRDFIGRVYDFASWSVNESGSEDASLYAVVGFYEDLPRYPQVRTEMPRWISLPDYHKFREVFKTFLNDKQFTDFEAGFLKQRGVRA